MGKSHRQMLEKLRDCASTQQQAPLLQNYLQSQNLPSKGTVKLNALFKKAVLVTLHCNRMSFAPYKPLDLGIATFDRQSVTKSVANSTSAAGPHAQNYLENIWFMHALLEEYAHLPDTTDGPHDFYFGNSVFASKEDVKGFLTQIWQQPIDEEKPELGFRPVICLHYSNGSGSMLASMWKEIEFDPGKMDTTIAMLDGQVIAQQANVTHNQYAEIDYILQQFYVSPHGLGHAGNTAAYVIIAAILSTLRRELYHSAENVKSKAGRHGQSASVAAQVVINGLMERPTPVPPCGVEVYCYRCGSNAHYFHECPNTDFTCSNCQNSPVPWKRENAASHKEGLCIFRRKFFY